MSCPVALYPASSEREKISFHQINEDTGNRIKYLKVDAETGKPVESDKIIKGYEVGKGQYIEVEPEELEAIAIESKRTIEIDEFVPKKEIDELYLNNPYYIAPNGEVGQHKIRIGREKQHFFEVPRCHCRLQGRPAAPLTVGLHQARRVQRHAPTGGTESPRFSRNVVPTNCWRNRPRRCNSGTTKRAKSSSAPGTWVADRTKPSQAGATNHCSSRDSASFPFRFIDVHARAARDRCREQFFEVPYGLHHVANRPAKIGDKLVATEFKNSITRGFAAVGQPNVAVCLLPGTEIAFDQNVECEPSFRIGILPNKKIGQRLARFRQVNMDNSVAHHDALEFPDGQV